MSGLTLKSEPLINMWTPDTLYSEMRVDVPLVSAFSISQPFPSLGGLILKSEALISIWTSDTLF